MDNLKLDAIMMEALKSDPITFGEYLLFVLLLCLVFTAHFEK